MNRTIRIAGITMMTAATALGMRPEFGWSTDFGTFVGGALNLFAPQLFGVDAPLVASALTSADPYRKPGQNARAQLRLAPGLSLSYLTRNTANDTDMMALFPEDNPTHLITCVEGGAKSLASFQAGRINITLLSNAFIYRMGR